MTERQTPRAMLVNHVGEISGAENSMLALAGHLDRDRFEPVAAVPAGRLARELDDRRVPVSLIPQLRLSRPRDPWQMLVSWFRVRSWAKKLRTAAEELGADLIAANSLTAAIGAAVGPGRMLPLVWHARDIEAPDRAVRWVVPRVTRIAAISACVADAIGEQALGASEITTLIYNGIDAAQLQPRRPPAEVRQEFEVPPEATLIGTVGQLVPWKRQDLFLETAARVLAHLPRAHFLIVGADLFGEHPDYVSELRGLRDSLGLGERAIFTGFREDVASVISAMDLLVHPAEREPLGRVLLEAMSLGVPCVAVDRCGPAEIIEDGHSGLLVGPDDPEAMSSRIVELFGRHGALQRMGQAARERVRDRFSVELMAWLTEDLYEEALVEARR